MISSFSFWVYIILPLFLIFIVSLFFFNISKNEEKLKKKHKRSGTISASALFLFTVLIIGNIIFFPTIYIAENCGKFETKTLIFPIKINGEYVFNTTGLVLINKTNNTLIVESHNYEANNYKNKITQKVLPKTNKVIPIKEIDFIFHKLPPVYKFKKYENTTKYSLNCENISREMSVNYLSNGKATGTIFWEIVFYTLGGIFGLIIIASVWLKISNIINKNKSHY